MSYMCVMPLLQEKNDKAKCLNFQESSVNEKQFKNMKGPYDLAIPLVDIYSKQLKAGT